MQLANLAISPFNLLKASFGSLQAIYTWGEETEYFKDGINEFHDNINHTLSDVAGIVSTKAGKNLRKGCVNKANKNISLSAIVGFFFLSFMRIFLADGMHTRYNSKTGEWETGYYYDFNKYNRRCQRNYRYWW